jgi:hypothetical protein
MYSCGGLKNKSWKSSQLLPFMANGKIGISKPDLIDNPKQAFLQQWQLPTLELGILRVP